MGENGGKAKDNLNGISFLEILIFVFEVNLFDLSSNRA